MSWFVPIVKLSSSTYVESLSYLQSYENRYRKCLVEHKSVSTKLTSQNSTYVKFVNSEKCQLVGGGGGGGGGGEKLRAASKAGQPGGEALGLLSSC